MKPFIEQDCVFHGFTAGGASIFDCPDGRRRGVVYVDDAVPGWNGHQARVTMWHGDILATATLGPIYRGNFCRMRSVAFTLDGIRYTGRYCPDTSQAVRVRSAKLS